MRPMREDTCQLEEVQDLHEVLPPLASCRDAPPCMPLDARKQAPLPNASAGDASLKEEVPSQSQAWSVEPPRLTPVRSKFLPRESLLTDCSTNDLTDIMSMAVRQELDQVSADIMVKVRRVIADMMNQLHKALDAPVNNDADEIDEDDPLALGYLPSFTVTQELAALNGSPGATEHIGRRTTKFTPSVVRRTQLKKPVADLRNSDQCGKNLTVIPQASKDEVREFTNTMPPNSNSTGERDSLGSSKQSILSLPSLTAQVVSGSMTSDLHTPPPKLAFAPAKPSATLEDGTSESKKSSLVSALQPRETAIRLTEVKKSVKKKVSMWEQAMDQLSWSKGMVASHPSVPSHDLSEDSCVRAALRGVVGTTLFDMLAASLVFANAAFIGVQCDYGARHSTDIFPGAYRVCEVVFCVVFTMELTLRIYVFRFSFFHMPGWEWNVFDCVIVGVQLVEELVNIILAAASSAMPPMSALRVMRIMRLIRVVRFVRIMRLIGELRTLVSSITSSLKCLLWTVILIFLFLYMVGVFFTQAVTDHRVTSLDNGNHDNLIEWYGTLDKTILSLFMSVTGGIDWYSVISPLNDQVHPVLMWTYTFYVAFTFFALLNVVTGVFVESALKKTKEEKDIFVLNNVRELFLNEHGEMETVMTWNDFERQLDRPQMLEYFKAIDVDPSGARYLFNLLDMNKNDSIDAEEFLSGCLRLRGPAKALDLQLLSFEVKRISSKLNKMTPSQRLAQVEFD